MTYYHNNCEFSNFFYFSDGCFVVFTIHTSADSDFESQWSDQCQSTSKSLTAAPDSAPAHYRYQIDAASAVISPAVYGQSGSYFAADAARPGAW